MKTNFTRLVTTAALIVALFVPGIQSSYAEGVIPTNRPPLPPSSSIVTITSSYILYSDGTSVFANGSISTPDGVVYLASSYTYVYPDGTMLSPNGTVCYADGTIVSCTKN